MKKGKALFGGLSADFDRKWQGGNADDLVSIDHPGHAMFQVDSGDLRSGSAQTVLRNWSPSGTQSLESADPDLWTEDMLLDVPDKLRKGEFGIFSPLFRNTGDGDGFAVTRQLGNQPITTAFGRRNWKEGFTYLVSSLKRIPRYVGPLSGEPKPFFSETLINTGGGEDIVMPGWLGNGIVDTGDGADIILSSPQSYAISLYDTRRGGGVVPPVKVPYDSNHYVYYPSAYSTKGTAYNPNGNVYKAGKGDDLIYYDSGVSQALGEEGDDVFAPSFGSFNWAVDTLIQRIVNTHTLREQPNNYELNAALTFESPPVRVIDETPTPLFIDETPTPLFKETPIQLDDYRTRPLGTVAPYHGKKGLLSPLKIFTRARDFNEVPLNQTVNESYGDTYGYSLQFDALISREPPLNQFEYKERISDVLRERLNPLNSGLSKNSQGSVVLDQYVNVLGGQKLYGGPGNDIFYGLDPNFYQGFSHGGGWSRAPSGLQQGQRRGRASSGTGCESCRDVWRPRR